MFIEIKIAIFLCISASLAQFVIPTARRRSECRRMLSVRLGHNISCDDDGLDRGRKIPQKREKRVQVSNIIVLASSRNATERNQVKASRGERETRLGDASSSRGEQSRARIVYDPPLRARTRERLT